MRAKPSRPIRPSQKFGRLKEDRGDEFELPTVAPSDAADEPTRSNVAASSSVAAPMISQSKILCISACAGLLTVGTFLAITFAMPSTMLLPAELPPLPPSTPQVPLHEPPPSPPLMSPASPAAYERPRGNYVGGCKSPWPRASFADRTSCDATTACAICRRTSTSCSVATITLPSGMQFPRHNVAQFSGNAIWDGPTLGLGSAVRAMLGSPFDFATSPEMDALSHVFAGRSSRDTAAALRSRWHDDSRYPAYEMAKGSRGAFLSAMSRLTADYVLNHPTWASLAPRKVRRTIEASFATGHHNSLEQPAAICAAAIIMDGIFAHKSTLDIWVSSLMAAGSTSRNAEADPDTLMRHLYIMDAPAGESVEVDPSSDIYTTPYQTNALGFYGGNLTFVFKPALVGGSGTDTQYVASRICPGPPPKGQSEADWHREWCRRRDEDGVLEFARSNGDAGETRTPNYKEPHEVDGVLFFAWGPTPSAWTSGNAFDFDVSTLIRPLEWGFYRASKEALQTEESEHVLIVAPGLIEGGVYGIIPQPEDKSPTKFVATKPPPQTLGGERADREIAPGVPFATLDRAIAEVPEKVIPVWGVLYRCASSNLRAHPPTFDLSNGEAEKSRLCAAASTLRKHATSTSDAVARDAALRRSVEQARLPSEIVVELMSQNVWPSVASVDLAASPRVVSPAPPDAICSLSIAGLRSAAVQEVCGE